MYFVRFFYDIGFMHIFIFIFLDRCSYLVGNHTEIKLLLLLLLLLKIHTAIEAGFIIGSGQQQVA